MDSTSQTVILINPFEVPQEADEPFVAGWERTRDFLATKEGFSTTALHRALRPDAEFRFVNVARVDSPQAWQQAISDPAFPGGKMPFKAHPGLYEVVREDGAPDAAGVVLINPFEVPVGEDERFVAGWDAAREALAGQDGYLGTRLHRSLSPQADFRFVNLARWATPAAFMQALQQPEFQQAAQAMPFESHPSLYEVVRD